MGWPDWLGTPGSWGFWVGFFLLFILLPSFISLIGAALFGDALFGDDW